MNIKFLKIKKKSKKGNLEINPDMYWKIILAASFFLILLSCGFGFLTFIKVDKGEEVSVPIDSGQVGTVKKERISKALDYFKEREQKSKDILNASSSVVDPSL